jgi:hypothetical protein
VTNAEILKEMGLTDSELRDLLHKTNTYYHSLNEAQRRVILSSQRSTEEAAATLHANVSAEQLEHFLRAHGQSSDVAIRWCKAFWSKDDDDEASELG